jgi:hypothetical protein
MCDKGCGKYKKRKLSGSTNGLGIQITATTNGARQYLHVALPSVAANEFDEVYLSATNITGSAVKLTVLWGWNNSSDQIIVSIPAQAGLTCIVPGLVLQGGGEVTAFADTASAVTVHGYVNRYENNN